MHEIETHTQADGTVIAAAAFARVDAWHGLGHTTDGLMTGEELLVNGKLGGWNLRKVPAFAALPVLNADGVSTDYLPVPGKFVVIRDNPFTGQPEALESSVGNVYQPIQNEQLIELGDALVQASEGTAHWDTGGSLRGGRQVFATIELNDQIMVGGVDPLNLKLALLDYNDGRGALTAITTPIRVVCANTQAAALANFKTRHSIWHTDSAMAKLELARKELQLTVKYGEALAVEFDKMVQQSVTDAWFTKHIVHKLWVPPKADASTRAKNTHHDIEASVLDLFRTSPTMVTPSGESIKGTRYGAYQAITEHLDFFSPVPRNAKNAQALRAQRVILGATDDVKQKAFALLKV